jgi:hypothetical protein
MQSGGRKKKETDQDPGKFFHCLRHPAFSARLLHQFFRRQNASGTRIFVDRWAINV